MSERGSVVMPSAAAVGGADEESRAAAELVFTTSWTSPLLVTMECC